MKHFFLLLFVSVLSHVSFSQEKTIQYMDEMCLPVSSPEKATYYRTVEKKGEGFVVRDYYADIKVVQMVAECSAYDPKLILNGKMTAYYKNGNVQSTSQYVDNKQSGTSLTYYENGKPKAESAVTESGEQYKFYLSSDGTDLLHNGSAIIAEDENKVLQGRTYRVVEDYKLTAAFQVNQKNDTTYMMVEKQAEYKTGLQGLARDLQRNIVYPKVARRLGTEGTVFVKFKVGRTGRATDIDIVKGVSPECDAESIRVVELLANNWIPAAHHGKPVATMFVLPVKYKLAGKLTKR